MAPQAAASSMILLVVLMLSAEAGSGAAISTKVPEPFSVPVPTKVLIKSYNLDPVLCWEYQNMSQTPIFTVQVKNFKGPWIDSCTNISDHCCNIYEQIKNPDDSVWARVKAKVGEKESDYAVSEEFIICLHGKIGPPGLDIRRRGDQLVIDVFHPAVVIKGTRHGVMYEDDGACHTFDYEVNVRTNTSGKIQNFNHGIPKENCNETLCRLIVPVSPRDYRVCVSVSGVSDYGEVETETSKDSCISLPHDDKKDSIWILVVVPFIIFLIVILVFACWLIKKNPFKRKSIMLPKSLLLSTFSVVKHGTWDTKSDSKYVTFSKLCQPDALNNETVICEEPLPTVTAPDNPGKAQREELSDETAAMLTEGSTFAETPESPPTPIQRSSSFLLSSNQSEPCSIATYHSRNGSDSGLVGSGSSTSDSGFLPHNNLETKTTEQEPAPIRKVPTSGYDKPHMLVDVLVDGDRKESLIGYRLTTDTKELS